ncbi:MAG: iron-sulfur cluster assembly protein, partial [Candidatus Zixiibacteriota bacterium]
MTQVGDGLITEETIVEALRECYDPEIPVNIVDLGLVYQIRVIDG